MSEECLFCKIVKKEVPAEIIYEDDLVMAFKDINPVAPYHYLIIPKKHIATVNDASKHNQMDLGAIFVAARKIAERKKIAEDGYRLIINTNKDAGQIVFHLHAHMLAGHKMGWKPVG